MSTPKKIVRRGITGGYDFNEMEDGSFVILQDGKVVCTHPSHDAMHDWIDEQRRKRLAAKQVSKP